MSLLKPYSGMIYALALAAAIHGCSSSGQTSSSQISLSGTAGGSSGAGSSGSLGSAGNIASGSSGDTSSASGNFGQGTGNVVTGSGSSGTSLGGTGAAGTGASGNIAATGSVGGTGSGVAGGGTGSAGAGTGTAGGSGTSGASTGTVSASGTTPGDGGTNPNYPPPPRPINVMPGNPFSTSFNGQPMYLNKSKPAQGKLVLLLGGICTGPGAGGFESFIEQYGFHVFGPKTDMCLTGGSVPAMYKTAIAANPMDPEANRQVGDARMELWDGKPRVSWYTPPAMSIVQETVAALKYGMMVDPGGDWGYFLDSTGNGIRTSDVWVVGYSWGSQTWAMISAYVPFGRVITTSGPQSEGWPNALWITQPSPNGTPGDRKYMLVGFTADYPSTSTADSGVMGMVATTTKAGWIGPATNVHPGDMGPYMSTLHLFAMVGGNGGTTPGGHTVFCNNNPLNGWLAVCKYVAAQQ